MKILNEYKSSDLLFLDIETCRGVDKLDPSSQLYEAFLYKFRYSNELKDKGTRDGSEVEVTIDELWKAKASLYATFAKIVTIVVGKIVPGEGIDDTIQLTAYKGDEKTLLENFCNDLSKFTVARPGAAFCSYHGIGFDLPFITKRMLVRGLHLPPMLDTATQKPWEIRTLDLAKLWQGTSFYSDSLLSVATALGIPSPKKDMSGEEVSDAFYAGRIDDIVEYCKQDVLATCNIYRRFSQKSLVKIFEEGQPSTTNTRII